MLSIVLFSIVEMLWIRPVSNKLWWLQLAAFQASTSLSKVHIFFLTCMYFVLEKQIASLCSGLEASPVQQSGPGRFSSWADNYKAHLPNGQESKLVIF